MATFVPITDGVYLRRFPILDVNSVLVTGTRRALLVDTLSTDGQGAALADDVRTVTDLPVDILNTHGHFDHVLGNRAVARVLDVRDIWAHPDVIDTWTRSPRTELDAAVAECADLAPEIAADVAVTRPLAPNRPAADGTRLDLGGRVVTLRHAGPAHTTGDVMAIVDGVVIAGDLVEEGAAPDTTGSDLDGWVAVLDVLLPSMTGVVIPGHGAPVDAAFVARQRDWLHRRTRQSTEE